MIYRIIRHGAPTSELDCGSDLIARQFAMADRSVERVETRQGRVVYRRTREDMPDIDLSSFEIDPEAVERFDRKPRRTTK